MSQFIAWDPNQLEGSDDEGGSAGGSGGEESGNESGEEASDEEDDKTWMVRRAAAKTVTSIVTTHPDRLDAVVEKAVPELIKQFKVRPTGLRFARTLCCD